MTAMLALSLTAGVTLRDLESYVQTCRAAGLPPSTEVALGEQSAIGGQALTVAVAATRTLMDAVPAPTLARPTRARTRARRGAVR